MSSRYQLPRKPLPPLGSSNSRQPEDVSSNSSSSLLGAASSNNSNSSNLARIRSREDWDLICPLG